MSRIGNNFNQSKMLKNICCFPMYKSVIFFARRILMMAKQKEKKEEGACEWILLF